MNKFFIQNNQNLQQLQTILKKSQQSERTISNISNHSRKASSISKSNLLNDNENLEVQRIDSNQIKIYKSDTLEKNEINTNDIIGGREVIMEPNHQENQLSNNQLTRSDDKSAISNQLSGLNHYNSANLFITLNHNPYSSNDNNELEKTIKNLEFEKSNNQNINENFNRELMNKNDQKEDDSLRHESESNDDSDTLYLNNNSMDLDIQVKRQYVSDNLFKYNNTVNDDFMINNSQKKKTYSSQQSNKKKRNKSEDCSSSSLINEINLDNYQKNQFNNQDNEMLIKPKSLSKCNNVQLKVPILKDISKLNECKQDEHDNMDIESTTLGKSTTKNSKFMGINNINCNNQLFQFDSKSNQATFRTGAGSPRPSTLEIDNLTNDILNQMSQIKKQLSNKENV